MEPDPSPPRRRRARIREVARETLGYERLRPGQMEAIEAVLEGRDTLAVLASGQGKSAIYQLAGTQLEGPTIVVSPLLSLQRDQVAAIEQESLGGAAALNSMISVGDRTAALEALDAGELEFLFVSPEQLENEELLGRLAAAEPSLFVVDEAHCISDWGHDFRPEYLRLRPVIEALGGPVILAITATAAPPVRQEITDRLGMDAPMVIVRGFDRPNIHLAVRTVDDATDKHDAVLDEVTRREGSGIVYVATRKATEEVAATLRDAGVRAAPYHAGLSRGRREEAEAGFHEGRISTMVATVAFGMGIDKPDVRFVIHHDVSGSLNAYYQEIGRAGRDGEPAEAVLLYRPEDLGLRRYFGAVPELGEDELRAVLDALDSEDGEERIVAATGLGGGHVRATLDLLTSAGAAAFQASGCVVRVSRDDDGAIRDAIEAQQHRVRYERSRLDMVRGYAETRQCRRAFLLSYFGEAAPETCANCDNCLGGSAAETAVEGTPALFAAGDRVAHATLGDGQVIRASRQRLAVLFEGSGYRTLDVEMVVEGELLERVDREGGGDET